MKKLYSLYTESSAPIRITCMVVFLFVAYTLIDWAFEGAFYFSFQSMAKRMIDAIIMTVLIDVSLVPKSIKKNNINPAENK